MFRNERMSTSDGVGSVHVRLGAGEQAMAPKTPTWELEEHTKAKHKLLRLYLDAWIPIVGRDNPRIGLIDGYAGPGVYKGGGAGSPIVMLEAYLQRADLASLRAAPLFIFVEKDRERFSILEGELAKVARPENVDVRSFNASFDDVLDGLLDSLDGKRPIPIFMFVDPFGYDYDLEDIGRLVSNPRCEALTFLPTPFIGRFVDQPQLAPTISRALDSDDWMAARGLPEVERDRIICDVFAASLRRSVEYVLAFHVETAPNSSYDLFFATRHPKGVNAMKDAMWKVDPTGTYRWHTGNALGQTVMFSGEPDAYEAGAALRELVGDRVFTIEEAEGLWLKTRFRSAHLRKAALKPLERQPGRLEVIRPPGCREAVGQYPPGTRLRLRDQR